MVGFGKNHSFWRFLGAIRDGSRKPRVVPNAVEQGLAVGIPIFDFMLGNAGFYCGAGDRGGDVGNETRIQRLGNDQVASKNE